jgi:hypothetical protein
MLFILLFYHRTTDEMPPKNLLRHIYLITLDGIFIKWRIESCKCAYALILIFICDAFKSFVRKLRPTLIDKIDSRSEACLLGGQSDTGEGQAKAGQEPQQLPRRVIVVN